MATKALTELSKELKKKVDSAVKKGRYFVAVIEFNEENLDFYYAQQNFPNAEVFPSLQRITEMYKKETMKLVDDKK